MATGGSGLQEFTMFYPSGKLVEAGEMRDKLVEQLRREAGVVASVVLQESVYLRTFYVMPKNAAYGAGRVFSAADVGIGCRP